MSQILKFSRPARPMWSDLAHIIAREPARHELSRLPDGPQLYRSEAVGEDLADLYPMLSLDMDVEPRRRRSDNTGHAVLAVAWVTSLVLATVAVIHTTLA